jgi:transketolase
MRNEFMQALVARFEKRKDFVFITADLGYRAVEGVAETFGRRFINAGVAEQNAVSLAAGLARGGQLPWVYSMAVFVTLRPLAQIRDNVCLHRLPVKLVGNGGGYGYGIMGPTHHALEDLAVMRALPHMRVYVPLVASDLPDVVERMEKDPLPNYLRLNESSGLLGPVPAFAPWRKLKSGKSCVVVSTGPVVESLYEMGASAVFDELEIWSVGVFPMEGIPAELASSIEQKGRVITIEEHYRAGGLGEALGSLLLTTGVRPEAMLCLCSEGYPSGRYGSQRWHQEECGLRGAKLRARLEEWIRA